MTGLPARESAVVVLGSRTWGWEHPLGDLQLARAFARAGHNVLFVEPAAASGGGGARALVTPDGAPLQVMQPWQPTGRLPRAAPELRGRITARLVRRELVRLGWRAAVTIVVRPEQLTWRHLRSETLVYWQKDRQWAAPTALGRLTERAHAQLLAAADVVTGVSSVIVADNAALGRTAVVVGNAADVDHFRQSAPEPADLAGIPWPRVIFAGALGWRVATDELLSLAEQAPDLNFVLVGATDASTMFASVPNVHLIGTRTYDSLPAYLQACDVGLIPYEVNAFNAASCPLKFYEYAAAGLPVVASGVPTPHGLPEGAVLTTEAKAEALLGGIRSALSVGRRRSGVPSGLDWSDRVVTLLALTAQDERRLKPVEA